MNEIFLGGNKNNKKYNTTTRYEEMLFKENKNKLLSFISKRNQFIRNLRLKSWLKSIFI